MADAVTRPSDAEIEAKFVDLVDRYERFKASDAVVVAELRSFFAPLQAEVGTLRMRSEGAEYDSGLLLASLDERESDIADLRAQLAAHAATVVEQAATVGELEAEGVKLADEAIALRLTVEMREQTIATLTAVIAEKDAALRRPIARCRGHQGTGLGAPVTCLDLERDCREHPERYGGAYKVELLNGSARCSGCAAVYALALTPAALPARVAAERAVVEAATVYVTQSLFGEHIGTTTKNLVESVQALAALAARPEAT